ncbi:PEP-CTERM sorting domain-containing protein [Planctomycetota bacterium]|nr:PEP-CTERM sorting domain-containing protein [Planctomycetota bacterium]
MKSIFKCLAAAAVVATAGTTANAALTGSFSLVSEGLGTFDGSLQAVSVDVYHFSLTNDTGFDISSIEASFSGAFINNSTTSLVSQSGIEFPKLATFTFADTFFTNDGEAATFATSVDSFSELSGSGTVLGNGNAWVDNGMTEVIAVLSVAAGAEAPMFNSGQAAVNGELVNIVIPEPASVALLGLGGIALIARRRKA